MRKYEQIPILVKKGPIKVSYCTVVTAEPKVILAELECKSKYFKISGQGWSSENGPLIDLETTKETLFYDKRFCENSWTTIYFPTLKDWSIFAANNGKRTCYITFYKN